MRCIRCGSRNVAQVTKNDGYSITKGIAGQMLFGAGGAAAGINGKKKTVYHCSACGIDEDASMPSVIEQFINEAIEKNDAYRLRDYKKQYYNIEWSDTPSINNTGLSTSSVDSLRQDFPTHSVTSRKTNLKEKRKEISVASLANEVREYINSINAPVSDEDLYAKYEEYGKRKIVEVISDLKSKGKIKEAAPGIFVLVRDFEEMQQLIEMEKELQSKKEAEKNIVYHSDYMHFVHRAALLEGCLIGDASHYIYYLDTKGNVHCIDSCTSLRNAASVTEKKQRIVQQYGHDIRKFYRDYGYKVLFLKKDGTVQLCYDEYDIEETPELITYKKEMDQWEDIVSICEESNSFIGLKKDGTLVSVGYNEFGQCNVSDWKSVVKIQLAGECCYGLKDDGTVLVSGQIETSDKHDVEGWRNIVDIEANVETLIGLRTDGKVSVSGERVKQNEVSGWHDVIKIYAGPWGVAAIRSDGRAYSTGKWKDVNQWDGVIQLVILHSCVIGLKYDGTIVVSPEDSELGDFTCDWSDIISIIAWNGGKTNSFDGAIFGFKSDGSVICTDPNLNKACGQLKLYDDINKIEEERTAADKEAAPRLAKQAIIRKEQKAIAKELEERKKSLSEIEKDYKSSVASLNREKIEGAVPVDKEIKELNDKIWDMRKQFETLGFFKKKERKALENALAEAENSLGKAEKEREKQKAELISSIDDKISILRKKYEEQSKSLSEMILSLQEKVPEMIFKESEDPSPRPLNSKKTIHDYSQ